MKYPIAIRSLTCPENACDIVPTVLQVLWNLGKRCNYDCSYCSSHVHDAVSPFIDLDACVKLVNNTDKQVQALGKKIKWSFTGGEPFIDPGFMPLIKHIKSLPSTHSQTVTTNGSIGLSTLMEASQYLTNITVSLHLERPESEVNAIVEKIIRLSQETDVYISVNLMFLPGKMDLVKNTIEKFQPHAVKYILRKIWDLGDDEPNPVPRKSRDLGKVDQQVKNKISNRAVIDIKNEKWLAYTAQELQMIDQSIESPTYINIGMWDIDQDYHEIHSDLLLSNDMINFKNWVCYAGVDSAFIDFDGSIYRGMCMNGGAVSTISMGKIFFEEPTICHRNRCFCNHDMSARKSVQERQDLITP